MFPYVLKFKWQVATKISVAHLFLWSVMKFQCTHIDAFVSPWNEYKNSVAVEIWLLHLQSLRNSNFHFLKFMQLATSKVLIKLRKRSFVWVKETTLGRSPIPQQWGSGSCYSRVVANAEPDFYSDGIFKLMQWLGKSALMCSEIMLKSNGTLMGWMRYF